MTLNSNVNRQNDQIDQIILDMIELFNREIIAFQNLLRLLYDNKNKNCQEVNLLVPKIIIKPMAQPIINKTQYKDNKRILLENINNITLSKIIQIIQKKYHSHLFRMKDVLFTFTNKYQNMTEQTNQSLQQAIVDLNKYIKSTDFSHIRN